MQAPLPSPDVERLTWREICARFPDQWVVLVDATWVGDDYFEFGTARVLAHGTSRRDATKRACDACDEFEDVSCFFTGRIRGPIPRFGLT